MAPVNDYGMKVSRQGIDVKTCSDSQLLWSSSFRMPLVIQTGTYGISDPTSTQTIVTHNLGYTPICFPLVNGFNFSGGDNGSCDFDCGNSLAGGGVMNIDDTKIWYRGGSFSSSKTVTYFIFPLDLEQDISGVNINTTDDTVGSPTTDYGWKVSKTGEDVLTADLSELASFSGTSSEGFSVRHQIIHKVGGVSSLNSGSTATIAHGLGYKPMFLFYADGGADGYSIVLLDLVVVAGPAVVVKARCWADATNIYFKNDSGGTHSLRYVIFKDPLL
jgi:hypothetical protein